MKLFTVAVALGLRKGETLGLRWTDVDLDEGHVQVVRALHAIKGDLPAGWDRLTPTLALGPLKTKRSQRELELRPFAVAAPRTHRARQLEERLAAGPDWKDHGLVFTTSLGTPIVPRNLTRSLKALLKKARHVFTSCGIPAARCFIARACPLVRSPKCSVTPSSGRPSATRTRRERWCVMLPSGWKRSSAALRAELT